MEIETKVLKGYSKYRIDRNGNVYNKRGKMKQYDKDGYKEIYLYSDDKKRKLFLVHRLVAFLYIPNPNSYPEINHKDENRGNNSISNLEWCTSKYNANYGHHIEKLKKRMQESNPWKGRKHRPESIEKMRLQRIGKPSKQKKKVLIDNVEYESVKQAMVKLNISTRRFYKLLNTGGNCYVREM